MSLLPGRRRSAWVTVVVRVEGVVVWAEDRVVAEMVEVRMVVEERAEVEMEVVA